MTGSGAPKRILPEKGALVTATLGGYELGEVLGRGAMGEVRSGTRNGSDTRIAVKVLRPELVDDPQLIARFLRTRRAVQP